MRELTDIELKDLQLDVLQEFHDFCMKHGLKYSLCAGTLLGAIRHGGYIPWDDDIDVMMPREEYEKFFKLYSSDEFTLFHYSLQDSYCIPYAKLSDNRTIIKEDVRCVSEYGVNIDIFPLDYFPKSIEESQKWCKDLLFYKNLRLLKDLLINRQRSITKNLSILLTRVILLPFSMKFFCKKINLLSMRYLYDNSGYLGNMTNGYSMKERNPKATSLIDCNFEGRKFKVINNYDIYLRGLFGNYMKLPPVEKRISHHGFTAWWKD